MKSSGGVPEKVCVGPLKDNHDGNGLPSANVAVYVRIDVSASVNVAFGTLKVQSASSADD